MAGVQGHRWVYGKSLGVVDVAYFQLELSLRPIGGMFEVRMRNEARIGSGASRAKL